MSQHLGAIYLRIDTIEHELRQLCKIQVEGEGYELAYKIAADNLRQGLDVVADSCNPVEVTRREWEAIATASAARFVNIEVICTDAAEHRQRIESRSADIAGFQLPSWGDVMDREYDPWTKDRIVLDTAGSSVDQAFAKLLDETSPNGTMAPKD